MIWTLVIGGIILVFSLGLFGISILSYRRYKNRKLLFVSTVFFLFFIKGILSVLSIFLDFIPKVGLFNYSGLIDLAVLILLYMATLKR